MIYVATMYLIVILGKLVWYRIIIMLISGVPMLYLVIKVTVLIRDFVNPATFL